MPPRPPTNELILIVCYQEKSKVARSAGISKKNSLAVRETFTNRLLRSLSRVANPTCQGRGSTAFEREVGPTEES